MMRTSKKIRKFLMFIFAFVLLGFKTVGTATSAGAFSFYSFMSGLFRKVSCESDFIVDSQGMLERYSGTADVVIIPDNVKKISYRAFWNQEKIKIVVFPKGLLAIEDYAFYGCSRLQKIVLPESVETVGQLAFGNCGNLKSAYFGKNLKNINQMALWGCAKLSYVSVHKDNEYYSSLNGLLYNKDKAEVLFCPQALTGNITLHKNVVTVKSNAFYNCAYITSVKAYDNLMYVDECAFHGCKNLKKVDLGKQIKKIRSGAFENCVSLLEFNVPETVKELGCVVFLGCKDIKVNFFTKTVKIGEKIFNRKDNATIRGYVGSTAHKYAQENKFNFQEI